MVNVRIIAFWWRETPMKLSKIMLASVAGLAVMACEPAEESTVKTEEAATSVEAAPVAEVSPLDAALAGDWRVAKERDAWRNPKETLEFFGVKSSDTVVEIWPGGGWYTSVLGPYLKSGNGKLIAASFDPAGSDYAKRGVEKYTSAFLEKPEIYGDIELTVASKDSDGLGVEGTADVVLTFRNVHNWMKGQYVEKMLSDSFRALKPGGVLGVVEHRLPSGAEQDPEGKSGYVHESLVIQMAEEAGFVFEGSSEINANSADTADHPYGVWTLPPVSRAPKEGEDGAADFDAAKYVAIGESDRMTLKFVKPASE